MIVCKPWRSVIASSGRRASFGRTIVTFLPEAAESNPMRVPVSCDRCWHPIVAMTSVMIDAGSRSLMSLLGEKVSVQLLVVPGGEDVVGSARVGEVRVHPKEEIAWMEY